MRKEFEIPADEKTLREQAIDQAQTNMGNAVRIIDEKFGEGYSANHPEMVIAFMNAAGLDYQTMMIAKSILELKENINEISNQLNYIRENADNQ